MLSPFNPSLTIKAIGLTRIGVWISHTVYCEVWWWNFYTAFTHFSRFIGCSSNSIYHCCFIQTQQNRDCLHFPLACRSYSSLLAYWRISSLSPTITRSFHSPISQRQPPQGHISDWLRGTYITIIRKGRATYPFMPTNIFITQLIAAHSLCVSSPSITLYLLGCSSSSIYHSTLNAWGYQTRHFVRFSWHLIHYQFYVRRRWGFADTTTVIW